MKQIKTFEGFNDSKHNDGKYNAGDRLIADRNYLGYVEKGEEYRIVYKERNMNDEFYILELDSDDTDKRIEWENSEEYEFSEEELDDFFTKK